MLAEIRAKFTPPVQLNLFISVNRDETCTFFVSLGWISPGSFSHSKLDVGLRLVVAYGSERRSMFLPREMPFYFLFHWGDVHLSFILKPLSFTFSLDNPTIIMYINV